jgi:hypothetical protein
MSSFNFIYQNKIRQLEEENTKLRNIVNSMKGDKKTLEAKKGVTTDTRTLEFKKGRDKTGVRPL